LTAPLSDGFFQAYIWLRMIQGYAAALPAYKGTRDWWVKEISLGTEIRR
jgi:hypothetical protein